MDIKSASGAPAARPAPGQKTPNAAGTKKDPEALRRVSQQFEAIFIQQMFKGMRATVPAGGLQENDRSIQIFQDLMDQQVADDMARRQGLGIADALLRQLQDKTPK